MARKKPIISPLGQWAYPGEVTIIPSSDITMKGVNYPVLGVDNLGNQQMMMPGQDYTFPGDYVTEIPQMGKGGLAQWFDEKWVDVKTGKACGRSGKDKDGRPYPACRPSKRVNETTPKTTSEMSSSEKAKFKREKTSGKRIDYNHKRREDGGETGWLDEYQTGGTEQNPERMQGVDIKRKRKNVSDSPKYQYDSKGNLLYTPEINIQPYISDNSSRDEFLVNPKLSIQNLNPTVEEFRTVAAPYYPIDNKLVADPKINLQPSNYQQSLEQEYVLPQVVGKSFGNLSLVKDDGYSPNRRWVSNLRAKDTAAKFGKDSYAYVLKTNPNNLVDYPTRNKIENNLSLNNKTFYDYLAKNNYSPDTVEHLTRKLPDQIWNRAEQMRVEMRNNPEIMSWANLHNVDLGYKEKGESDDDFAPKIPESIYAARLAKAGLPTNRPDYEYAPMETYIVQDPSKFDLAGYFPMGSIVKDAEQKVLNKKIPGKLKREYISSNSPEYFEKEAYIKDEMAKRMGIDPSAFDTGEYLIHYNKTPITEYTPGKKYGGWLDEFQVGGRPTYQDSLALYNYNQLQRKLENKSDEYNPSFAESIIGNYSKVTPQGKKDQNVLRAQALKILKNNPNIKSGLYNIPNGLTRSSISDYDAAEGSYDLYHPGIKPQGAWFGIATNNDYSNVKPKQAGLPTKQLEVVKPISKVKNTVRPIYTSDLSKVRSYNDSNTLYNKTRTIENPKYYKGKSPSWYNFIGSTNETEAFAKNNNIDIYYTGKFPGKIQPVGTGSWGEGIRYPKYKKAVQPYILTSEIIPEAVGTPAVSIPVIDPPVKKIGYNKPVIQQFNYMSNENKAKALQKYGSVSDIPFQGVDINQLKNGGWLDEYQTAGEVSPKSIGAYTNQFNEEISGLKDWYEANRKRIGEVVPEAYLTYDQKSYPKPYGPESDPMNYNFSANKDSYNNKLIPGVKSLYDPITDTQTERYFPPVFPFNFPKLDFRFNGNESLSTLEQGIANYFNYEVPPDYDRFAVTKFYDANPPYVANWKGKQNINISNEPIDVDRFTAKNDPSTILSHETSHYLNQNNPEVFLFNRTKLAEMGITDTKGFKDYYGDGVMTEPSNTIDGGTKIFDGLGKDRKEDELLSDAYALKQDMRKKGFYDYTKGEKLTPEIWNKYKKEYPDNFIINRFIPVFEEQGQNNIEKLYNTHFPPLILNDDYNITDPFSPHLKNTKETPTFKTSDERIIHLLNEIVKNKDQNLNIAKYGGWLSKYQPGGGWAGWTPNVGKPYMRTSPAGNAGYSDNTRVVNQNTNVSAANRKAAEAAEYAKRVGSVNQGQTKSAYEKAREASSLVAQAQQRKGSADPLDYVLDMINPATYAFAASDLIGNTGSAVSNTAQGNFKEAGSDLLNAGLNTLYLLPAAAELRGPLKSAGKYLTTQTPLKNTYKYNPWAFKSNEANWYRQVGKSAIDDALETRLVREAGEEVSPRMYQEFEDQLVRMQGSGPEAMLASRRPISPFFSKGELFYPMGRKPTITKSGKISKNPAGKGDADYLIETNLPNESFQPAYVKGMSLGTPTEIGQTAILKPNPALRDIENFNLYKQDWLRGYKPVDVPNVGQMSVTPPVGGHVKNIAKELLGLTRNPGNKAAIAEGNAWLKNWIDDPITQAKIDTDLGWIPQRGNVLKDKFDLGYEQAKSFRPNTKEYPISNQIQDLGESLFLKNPNEHMHAGNKGISYLYNKSPLERDLIKNNNAFDREYNSFVSRNPSISQNQRTLTTLHEGTHDWTSDFLLTESGQNQDVLNLLSPNTKVLSNQFNKLRNQGASSKEILKTMGKENAYKGYYATPTETHTKIMEIRKLLNMTPEQSKNLTPGQAKNIINILDQGENVTNINPKFLDIIDRDPKKLAYLFNRLWAVPAIAAASQLQEQKQGGQTSWLNKYK